MKNVKRDVQKSNEAQLTNIKQVNAHIGEAATGTFWWFCKKK